MNKAGNISDSVTIDGEPVQQVPSFKYLRASLSNDVTWYNAMQKRIASITEDFKGYGSTILTSRQISKSTNLWSYPFSSSRCVRLGHFWLRWKKGSRCSRRNARAISPAYSTGTTKLMTIYEAVSKVSRTVRNLPSIKRLKMVWCGRITWHNSRCKTIISTLLKTGASGKPMQNLVPTSSKGCRISQCSNFWEPPPTDHCGRGYLLLLNLASHPRRMK